MSVVCPPEGQKVAYFFDLLVWVHEKNPWGIGLSRTFIFFSPFSDILGHTHIICSSVLHLFSSFPHLFCFVFANYACVWMTRKPEKRYSRVLGWWVARGVVKKNHKKNQIMRG